MRSQYESAVAQMKEREDRLERMQELQKPSFAPSLDPHSRALASKEHPEHFRQATAASTAASGRRRPSVEKENSARMQRVASTPISAGFRRVIDRGHTHLVARDRKLEERRRESEKAMMEGCTFKPRINPPLRMKPPSRRCSARMETPLEMEPLQVSATAPAAPAPAGEARSTGEGGLPARQGGFLAELIAEWDCGRTPGEMGGPSERETGGLSEWEASCRADAEALAALSSKLNIGGAAKAAFEKHISLLHGGLQQGLLQRRGTERLLQEEPPSGTRRHVASLATPPHPTGGGPDGRGVGGPGGRGGPDADPYWMDYPQRRSPEERVASVPALQGGDEPLYDELTRTVSERAWSFAQTAFARKRGSQPPQPPQPHGQPHGQPMRVAPENASAKTQSMSYGAIHSLRSRRHQ